MNENDRIRRVYAAYRASSSAQQRWSQENAGNRAIHRERSAAVRALLGPPLAGRRVLEIGCGGGGVLRDLQAFGAASLVGVDLLPDRLTAAAATAPRAAIAAADATALPFGDASFDIALLFTVISSVQDRGVAAHIAAEALRVLAPGGQIVWYDLRYGNPRNPHVRGISRREIAALFPGTAVRLAPITLLPPLARRLGPLTSLLYPALALLPPLRAHLIGSVTKSLAPAR